MYKERLPIPWSIPQMATAVRTGPVRSQEPGAGAQALGPSATAAFQGTLAGS